MSDLYHYCSTATFHSIITSRSIWLSSLNQSNDKNEGRMISEAVSRLAEKDNLSTEITENLLTAVANLESLFTGFGFCLSQDGDLLSQWRGYAEDGKGVSIGFNRAYLDWIVKSNSAKKFYLSLLKVEYESDKHEQLVYQAYTEMRDLLESEEEFLSDIPSSLSKESEEYTRLTELQGRMAMLTMLKAAMTAYNEVFLLKHRAFSEEKEWRLLHTDGLTSSSKCNFRAGDDGIIPYKPCKIRNGPYNPITKVILGPRHNTPIEVIENYLIQKGFGGIEVIKSCAPYRI